MFQQTKKMKIVSFNIENAPAIKQEQKMNLWITILVNGVTVSITYSRRNPAIYYFTDKNVESNRSIKKMFKNLNLVFSSIILLFSTFHTSLLKYPFK